MSKPSFPRKLEKDDEVSGFESGAAELDDWLRRFAWQNQRANNTVTYVSLTGPRVVAYYAISVGGVEKSALPPGLTKGGRPDPTPVILLARLAVDRSSQGIGLGAGLLRDALERAAQVSQSVGAAALLVHARDETARAFYLSNGDFLDSPLDPLQLLLPMKDLRALFLK